MNAFDALVIGAGPSGATAATLLARQGRGVVLVEKAEFPRRKVCGEYISATTWPILEELGVAPDLLAKAGPPVERVGLFARDVSVDAPMPAPLRIEAWGRAVGREILDARLVEAARSEGVRVIQPAAVDRLVRDGAMFAARAGSQEIRAKHVVVATGSWERGPFTPRRAPRGCDLFGFKARFSQAPLPRGLMPLVLFAGGYGGLVHTDAGEVSFSCCIRRDTLAAARSRYPGSAGEAVIAHAMAHCRALRETLQHAQREGAWLSAGPIRPGIRHPAGDGVVRVGNAAGEAHPLVAEGISMAIQSGWLLAHSWDEGPRHYAKLWRDTFASRIRASSVFATLTVPAMPSRASVAVMERIPSVLTLGARWSGKARVPQAQAT
jgi:flavin-dependent dehydrogenase